MRKWLLLLSLCGASGALYAQAPVTPITSLDPVVAEARNQLTNLAQLLVGEQLTNPVYLHDLAMLLNDLAVSVQTMATHAEHGQITAAQRQALEAQLAQTRLMLDELNAQIGPTPR